ncbi:MAG: radical SAM protein [Georgfuchsia sp.]
MSAMHRNYGLLSVDDHSRDSAGMTYVYPVVSRRARGVSVGINLNPNNACNWQCVYCQVPGLVRGGPPPIDLEQLKDELNRFLNMMTSGSFMLEKVPSDARILQDIAFSGNGEPTAASEFPEALDAVVETLRTHSLLGLLKLRLITNGSQVGKAGVQRGLRTLAANNGEVWFKLDAATAAGIAKVNGVRISPAAHLRRLSICAELCPTWIQSCFFMRNGELPASAEIDAYIGVAGQMKGKIKGVHLYGLARPSMQPYAEELGRLPDQWFESLAKRLECQGLNVVISP